MAMLAPTSTVMTSRLRPLHHACQCLREDGCDSILATFITDHVETLVYRIDRLVKLREADPLAKSVIAGIHIEGPFINSEKGYVGASSASVCETGQS